ncbi:MAG: radical SAM family heme chaperone HemW [Cytophagaceae bacterium]
MPGIYIHIPFCRLACHYCDFHFSTNLSLKEQMLGMICREIEMRADYTVDKKIGTIYFGGGTPSLLSEKELGQIMNALHKEFSIDKDAEITLEANPDDLDEKTLAAIQRAGINRLSIGIQSFHEAHLKYLNRIHSAAQALNSVQKAQQQGFENISIDLIYGIPAKDDIIWNQDLETVLGLKVQHISSYCLTIEPSTVFGKWLEKKVIRPVDEEMAARQFEILMKTMRENGFEHYEISNFSLPELYSKHNTSYWQGKKYLGIGPGAHSFNGDERQFNISNNQIYINSILKGEIPSTIEKLSEKDKINEYLMTSLRTKWGCDLNRLKDLPEFQYSRQYKKIEKMANDQLITNNSGILILTDKGKLLADKIIYDLFLI